MSDLSTLDVSRRRTLPPTSYDALRSSIAARYPDLSRRLQQVAEYAIAHPDDMALETIAVIAERAGVPPSSLIRFAKALDFEGFSDMQRLFRARLIDRAPSYGERIRSLRVRHERADRAVPSLVLDDFVAASIEALERLRRELPPSGSSARWRSWPGPRGSMWRPSAAPFRSPRISAIF